MNGEGDVEVKRFEGDMTWPCEQWSVTGPVAIGDCTSKEYGPWGADEMFAAAIWKTFLHLLAETLGYRLSPAEVAVRWWLVLQSLWSCMSRTCCIRYDLEHGTRVSWIFLCGHHSELQGCLVFSQTTSSRGCSCLPLKTTIFGLELVTDFHWHCSCRVFWGLLVREVHVDHGWGLLDSSTGIGAMESCLQVYRPSWRAIRQPDKMRAVLQEHKLHRGQLEEIYS